MNGLKMSIRAACIAGTLAMSLPAYSAGTFFFDFEDGKLPPWLTSTTGGSGSTGVELHGTSKMAFVQHTGIFQHSLSYDFDYVPGQPLAFDMHAVAVTTNNARSFSGVGINFTNAFNVQLGNVGFLNVTSAAFLGAHTFAVDNVQHHYIATMDSFAAQAGLAPAAAISKVSMTFLSYAETTSSGTSTAQVWFDNVTNAVPEPSQQALMWAGLALLGIAVRRRRLRASSGSQFA